MTPDALPLEIREARLNVLLDAAQNSEFPCELVLPGAIVAGRNHSPARLLLQTRNDCLAMIASAKGRLVDDGVAMRARDDGTIQLLDRDFADPINGPLAFEARRRKGWLGVPRGWLRGLRQGAV
jgi:hypothetical protein